MKARLVQRHITNNVSCQICGAESETIIHSLFKCSAAQEIWDHSDLLEYLVDAHTESFVARWNWLYGKVEGKVLRRMTTLMWVAWRCENLIFFENEHPNVVMLAADYCRLVDDYMEYAKKVFFPATPNYYWQQQFWKCPPRGCIKANVDAYVPAVDKAGLGVVLRDEAGSIVLTTTKMAELATPECVEAQAMRYALSITKRIGYINLWIVSDVVNVIKTITLESHGRSLIHLI
ncbi:uncharacterized protein LOC110688925 [Chenopodium quinoa]|uniref:uncharacterized protein LOC110688925 n=1 Tax=Chenopodium quinoa TaxID=63459 RepID=UPI000B786E1C|nr:uncharacterized protein LOC110688925 [Chenopodium quinoa]